MAVGEKERHHLHTVAERALGAEGAATMMDLLPPAGWADVARKDDVAAVRRDMERLEGSLRTDMERLEGSLRTDMERLEGSLRGDMERLEGSLRGEMASVRNDIATLEEKLADRIDSQGNQVRAEFYKSQESQTRLIIFSMTSVILVVAGLFFSALKFA